MATVSVLYISDDVVGPHLELLRNICEPSSRSRPHLTIRYFQRLSIPQEYLRAVVTHVDLIEPGTFGLDEKTSNKNQTVFIRCKCDELAHLEHKPHFPASEFHITIYDGKDVKFAKSLLKILEGFSWRLRVQLPPRTMLTQIPVKPRGTKRSATLRTYTQRVQQIFQRATGEDLEWQHLVNLTDEERLKMASVICRQLFSSLRGGRGNAKNNIGSAKRKAGKYSRDNTPNKGKGRPKRGDKGNESEIHLTPPELAREITGYAVTLIDPNSKINFGDPAVGNGSFYAALLQVVPRRRITSAIGIDISPKQVAAAQWRWSHKGLQAMVADYLHMDKLQRRSLILANPPYLRHQEIPAKYKHDLRERATEKIGSHVSARSGLYVYFLLLSHEWMKPGAIAAWLIPSEFMQTAYGSVLRYYLTHKVELLRIHQFGHDDPQFENAKVLPCVVVFRNNLPNRQVTVLTKGGTLARESHNNRVYSYRASQFGI